MVHWMIWNLVLKDQDDNEISVKDLTDEERQHIAERILKEKKGGFIHPKKT